MRLDPKVVRSRIADILPVIEAECDVNPEFAEKLLTVLNIKKKKKGYAAFDPFAEYAQNGDEGLQKALEKITNEEIIFIVRTHRLDPSRLAVKWKNRERLIQFVMDRVKGLASKGSAFRTYGRDSTLGTTSEDSSDENVE